MVPFSSLSRLALLQVPGLVGEHSGVRDGPSPRGFSSGTSEVVQCNTEIPGGLAARRLLMRSGRNVRNACPHFPATPYQLLHDNYGILMMLVLTTTTKIRLFKYRRKGGNKV